MHRRRFLTLALAGTGGWILPGCGGGESAGSTLPAGNGNPPAPAGAAEAEGVWQTIPPLTLQAGSSLSIAQYFSVPAEFSPVGTLPAGVTLSREGILSAAADAESAVISGLAFVATVIAAAPAPSPAPSPAPAPAPLPAPTPVGSLRLEHQQTMLAASEKGSAPPMFGKHMSAALRPGERAMYLFGGDGTSWAGVGNNSHCFHFGKVLFPEGGTPKFEHFYPYLGIAGQVVPSGYDCCPFVYDNRRDAFWQIGGYTWGVTKEGWRGTPESGGVWKYTPGEPYGSWTHVSTQGVPHSGEEGMGAMYHPHLDMVLGVRQNVIWWYRCSDGTFGNVPVKLADPRDVGRWNALAYDEKKDEILFVTPWNGKLVAVSLANFPSSATSREIASVPNPYSAFGQFPTVWVPQRREVVCFYLRDRGIVSVNVDSGAVARNDYPASILAAGSGFVTQAVYLPQNGKIVGIVGQSRDVVVFGWQA